MALTYRENGAWGTGKGSQLTNPEIDGNFYDLATRLIAVETNGVLPAEISNFTLVGTQLTIYLSNGQIFGPYTIPLATMHFRGDWLPATAYFELDLVRVTGQGLFLVLRDHTSEATFNPTATIPAGLLYSFIIGENTSSTVTVWKISCDLASTENLVGTYNNGTDGVGATLTATSFMFDDFVPVEGNRILLKNQTNTVENGAYVVTSSTVLTRVEDFDEPNEAQQGAAFFIIDGTINSNTAWVLKDSVSTFGVSGLEFLLLSGSLPTIAPGFILGNPSNTLSPAVPASISAIFDRAFATTQGALFVRHATEWNISNARLFDSQFVVYNTASEPAAYQASGFGVDGTSPAGWFAGVRTNGSRTTPLPVLAEQILSTFGGTGFDGVDYSSPEQGISQFSFYSTENWTENAHGTKQRIYVIPNGTTDPLLAVDIESDGGIVAGNASGGSQGVGTGNFKGLFVDGVPVGSGGGSLGEVLSYATNKTLIISDAEKYLRCTATGNTTLTIPPNGDVAFPIGTSIHHRTAGDGKVTFVPGTAVTLEVPFGQTLTTPGAGATITLKKVAENTWDIIGHTELAT